ncbi:unnamed protein product [Ectocarpus sp. 8 AP-2014]
MLLVFKHENRPDLYIQYASTNPPVLLETPRTNRRGLRLLGNHKNKRYEWQERHQTWNVGEKSFPTNNQPTGTKRPAKAKKPTPHTHDQRHRIDAAKCRCER